MRRYAPTLFLTCALVVLPGCGDVELKEFSPPGGRCKVMMPANPQEKSQAVAGANLKMYVHEQRSGGYMLGIADMPIPPGEPDAKIQDRLDGAVQGAINNSGATLVKSDRVMLEGKHPGRAFEGTIAQGSKKGKMRARVYLVGTRMYQLVVAGDNSFVDAGSADKFLGSLTLTQ
jgi:hypothetical protein